jgi:thiol-disulfide isomerase/thioredoxin
MGFDFDKLMRGRNRNLVIGGGLIILLLLGILIWMYLKNRPQYDLEGENELINAVDATKKPDASSSGASNGGQPKEDFSSSQGAQNQNAQPKTRPAIVVFHSDGCIHCKSLMPTWGQLRQHVGKDVNVLDFEASKEREILQQNGVEGFPEIRFYPKGFPSQEYIKYDTMPGANRQLDSLVRFAMSNGRSA